MPEHGARDRLIAIHNSLRERICLLDYPPGTRLSEVALAADFDVSRTPLRRALSLLEAEGLVRSEHGVGTIVTDATLAELSQVYRLRVELIELTGRLDPRPPGPDFLSRFEALLERSHHIMATGDARAFTKFDMEVFHTLLDLTGNAPLRDIQARYYYQTKRIWLNLAMAAKLDLQDEFRIFHHELEAIHIALRSQDLTALAHIQRAHISMSFQRLQQASTTDLPS